MAAGYYATPEDAIAAAEADGYVADFEGKNCEDCAGWDGVSRRCDCGNRRVYWETDQYSAGWFARAVAY